MSILSLTLVVVSQAMACSLVFSRMNDLLNLLRSSEAWWVSGEGCFCFGKGPGSSCSFLHKSEGECDLFVIMVVDVFVDEEVELGVIDPGSCFLWVSIKNGWLSQL